jgi:transcription elongation factor GreB
MSKAFTKEDDDAPPPATRRRGAPVPVDVPNYVTADGLHALRAELASGAADEDRARELAEHLATAVPMDPPPPDERHKVGFGATVTVEDEHGTRTRYRLVGAIEAAPKAGAIYFMSPIAEALHDAQIGDAVELPKGEVEVIAIEY